LSTTDLKPPGASIYPSSGPRRWLPTPDGHRLPPLRSLIAAHDPKTRKSDFLLNSARVHVRRSLAGDGLVQDGAGKMVFSPPILRRSFREEAKWGISASSSPTPEVHVHANN
jgi:hypothetical protein